jgi:hypothetical protein
MAVPGTQLFDYEVQLQRAPDGSYRGVATTLPGNAPGGLAGRAPEICVTGDDLVARAQPSEAPPPRWLRVVVLLPVLWIPGLGTWLANRYIADGRHAFARAFHLCVPGLGARLRPGIKLRLHHDIYGGMSLPTRQDNEVTVVGDPEAPVLTFAYPRHEPW